MAGFNSALAGFKSAFDHSCKLLVTYRHEAELQTVGNVPKGKKLGAVSIRKTVLPGMAIPMLKIRRPNGRLIFNMEIAIRR